MGGSWGPDPDWITLLDSSTKGVSSWSRDLLFGSKVLLPINSLTV